jgi:hypothetical protein
VRRPGKGADSIILNVNRVRSSGKVIRIDHVDLTQVPPEEKRERVQTVSGSGS